MRAGGEVIALEEERGVVRAVVQGSWPTPDNVTIKLRPLNRGQWRAVIDVWAGAGPFTAQLLAGEMPQEIDQVFAVAGCSLFPATRGELETSCSCRIRPTLVSTWPRPIIFWASRSTMTRFSCSACVGARRRRALTAGAHARQQWP